MVVTCHQELCSRLFLVSVFTASYGQKFDFNVDSAKKVQEHEGITEGSLLFPRKFLNPEGSCTTLLDVKKLNGVDPLQGNKFEDAHSAKAAGFQERSGLNSKWSQSLSSPPNLPILNGMVESHVNRVFSPDNFSAKTAAPSASMGCKTEPQLNQFDPNLASVNPSLPNPLLFSKILSLKNNNVDGGNFNLQELLLFRHLFKPLCENYTRLNQNQNLTKHSFSNGMINLINKNPNMTEQCFPSGTFETNLRDHNLIASVYNRSLISNPEQKENLAEESIPSGEGICYYSSTNSKKCKGNSLFSKALSKIFPAEGTSTEDPNHLINYYFSYGNSTSLANRNNKNSSDPSIHKSIQFKSSLNIPKAKYNLQEKKSKVWPQSKSSLTYQGKHKRVKPLLKNSDKRLEESQPFARESSAEKLPISSHFNPSKLIELKPDSPKILNGECNVRQNLISTPTLVHNNPNAGSEMKNQESSDKDRLWSKYVKGGGERSFMQNNLQSKQMQIHEEKFNSTAKKDVKMKIIKSSNKKISYQPQQKNRVDSEISNRKLEQEEKFESRNDPKDKLKADHGKDVKTEAELLKEKAQEQVTNTAKNKKSKENKNEEIILNIHKNLTETEQLQSEGKENFTSAQILHCEPPVVQKLEISMEKGRKNEPLKSDDKMFEIDEQTRQKITENQLNELSRLLFSSRGISKISPSGKESLVLPLEGVSTVSPSQKEPMILPSERVSMVSPLQKEPMTSPSEEVAKVSPSQKEPLTLSSKASLSQKEPLILPSEKKVSMVSPLQKEPMPSPSEGVAKVSPSQKGQLPISSKGVSMVSPLQKEPMPSLSEAVSKVSPSQKEPLALPSKGVSKVPTSLKEPATLEGVSKVSPLKTLALPSGGVSKVSTSSKESLTLPAEGLSKVLPSQKIPITLSSKNVAKELSSQALPQILAFHGVSQKPSSHENPHILTSYREPLALSPFSISNLIPSCSLSQVMPTSRMSQLLPPYGLPQLFPSQGVPHVLPSYGGSLIVPTYGGPLLLPPYAGSFALPSYDPFDKKINSSKTKNNNDPLFLPNSVYSRNHSMSALKGGHYGDGMIQPFGLYIPIVPMEYFPLSPLPNLLSNFEDLVTKSLMNREMNRLKMALIPENIWIDSKSTHANNSNLQKFTDGNKNNLLAEDSAPEKSNHSAPNDSHKSNNFNINAGDNDHVNRSSSLLSSTEPNFSSTAATSESIELPMSTSKPIENSSNNDLLDESSLKSVTTESSFKNISKSLIGPQGEKVRMNMKPVGKATPFWAEAIKKQMQAENSTRNTTMLKPKTDDLSHEACSIYGLNDILEQLGCQRHSNVVGLRGPQDELMNNSFDKSLKYYDISGQANNKSMAQCSSSSSFSNNTSENEKYNWLQQIGDSNYMITSKHVSNENKPKINYNYESPNNSKSKNMYLNRERMLRSIDDSKNNTFDVCETRSQVLIDNNAMKNAENHSIPITISRLKEETLDCKRYMQKTNSYKNKWKPFKPLNLRKPELPAPPLYLGGKMVNLNSKLYDRFKQDAPVKEITAQATIMPALTTFNLSPTTTSSSVQRISEVKKTKAKTENHTQKSPKNVTPKSVVVKKKKGFRFLFLPKLKTSPKIPKYSHPIGFSDSDLGNPQFSKNHHRGNSHTVDNIKSSQINNILPNQLLASEHDPQEPAKNPDKPLIAQRLVP